MFALVAACSNIVDKSAPNGTPDPGELKRKVNSSSTAFQISGEAAKSLWASATTSIGGGASGMSLLRGILTQKICLTAELGRVSCHVVVRCISDQMLNDVITASPADISELTSTPSNGAMIVYAHGTAPPETKQAIARAFYGDPTVTVRAFERCSPPPPPGNCPGNRGPGYQCPAGMAFANSNFPAGTCYEAHTCQPGENSCPGESLCASIQYFSLDSCGNPIPGETTDHATLCAQGCVAKGTHIAMKDGTLKTIETLKAGDWVYNPVAKAPVQIAHVAKGVSWEPSLIISLDGKSIQVTPDHRFKLRNGKTSRADALRKDDAILLARGNFAKINKTEAKLSELKIYNLELRSDHQEGHWYSANGIAVGDLVLQRNLKSKRSLIP